MMCDHCFGTGRRLEHAEDCDEELCALNGDYYSCTAILVSCWCPLGRRAELRPALRRCYWLAHPTSQLRHLLDQIPIRGRRRLAPPRWMHHRLRRGGRARRPSPDALLRELLLQPLDMEAF